MANEEADEEEFDYDDLWIEQEEEDATTVSAHLRPGIVPPPPPPPAMPPVIEGRRLPAPSAYRLPEVSFSQPNDDLRGRGPAALAMGLQRTFVAAALAERGLTGPPAPLATWCAALGSVGVPSRDARELFQILDSGRSGLVPPSVFCDVDFTCKSMPNAMAEVPKIPLDLSNALQLRYRLIALGCRMRLPGATESKPIEVPAVAEACRRSGLLADEADVASLVRVLSERCGGVPGGLCPDALCQQLAMYSTSTSNSCALPRFNGQAFASAKDMRQSASPKTSFRWQPPAKYLGCTPIEIIVKFKDPGRFPWHLLPECTCGRKFEELCQLADDATYRAAEEAVRLLVDPTWDRDDQTK